MIDRLKTCRCCLQVLKNEEDLYEFSSEVAIDSDSTNFIKINTCYLEVTNFNISAEDEDITKICSSCLGDLKFCYLFKKKCMEVAKSFDQQENDDNDIESENVEQFSLVDDGSGNIKEELPIDDQCYIEYVEEEMICENPQDDEETDDGSDYKYNTKYDPANMTKRVKLESIEHEGTIYSCDLCPKTFDRKDYYRRHYRRAHLTNIIEEKTDQLTIEGKVSDISQMQLYQCGCGKINVTREEYEAHQAEHEGEARFKCKKCDQTFSSKEEARKHLNTAHSNDEKPFNCDICQKCFKNRYQLILHNRSHTGEKPHVCQICNRGFSMSSNLQKHLDTHSTEKPYQCSYCGQYFKTQRSLKFHTVCYHQPEAKVKCTHCDKSFVNKSYLKMHMLYHTGEKNFTCTICNSKYYKSSHLKRHIQNVHFKLRLMKCDYCASDFVRKETYKAHIISHHKRHLSDQEFEEVLEKIRKFQPPALDINQFTVEKQMSAQGMMLSKVEEGEIDVEEMIEEQIEDGMEKSEEGMIIETTDDYHELFDEEDEDDEAVEQ
ncbi:zinc finger protein 260-like [Chironomus tepperi]|uniref:zinc finger protein 260-like n=1 Tax=Chironomus tepperi TaxID=113505 RepID=UPI00391F90AF